MLTRKSERGFTLVEMAVVFAVVALLLGGLLIPLTTQVAQQRIADTQRALDNIREALIGFATVYGRLPCPDYDTDPASPGYGVEDFPCTAAPTAEGYLPWKTLGVSETDAWGIRRSAPADPWIGYWRYRVDRYYADVNNFKTHAFVQGPSAFQDTLRVQDKAGNDLTTTNERAIAIVYSAGKDTIPNLENATFNQIYVSDVIDNLTPSDAAHFDDVLIWLTRPVVVNRMLVAGRLP